MLGVVLAYSLTAGTRVLTSLIGAVVCFLGLPLARVGRLVVFRKEVFGSGDKFCSRWLAHFSGWRPILGILFLSGRPRGPVRHRQCVDQGRAGPALPPIEGATTESMAVPVAAGPEVAQTPESELQPESTFTPDFLRPGLSLVRRFTLLPWSVFLQPIPDEPPADTATGEVPQWQPEAHALPYGPWIALAALEVMLIGPTLVNLLEDTRFADSARVMFG